MKTIEDEAAEWTRKNIGLPSTFLHARIMEAQAAYLAGAAAERRRGEQLREALDNATATLIMLSAILKRKGYGDHDLCVFGITDAIDMARNALQNIQKL